MSKFFISRPIVAMVISILMVIVGAVTVTSLPVSQLPSIAPPEVLIQANYVGADSETVEQSVATPIEQQMSGVDNLNYMYSLNAANGQMTMIVDFDVKTDPNTDLILTQMRETQAASQLPTVVTNYGVTVQKSVTAPLMVIGLYSPHGTYDAQFLANYAYINLNDQLTRVPGIGNVQVFGAGQYAMRLWVKPDQLAKLGITVPEILSAIQSQNAVNPAGKVGGAPVPKGQEYTYSVRAQGRLTTPEEFGNITLREMPDGGIVRVKDVARTELGSQDYSVIGRLNGKPSAIVAVYQLPGSNAVQAADGVKRLLAEVKNRFPQDMDYVISLDTTRAVTEGMKDIVVTLLIAIVLVTLVVYLFLQGWRATLIPLLAVPVSLIGTFVFFPAFGFSINTLSLFGLVLAIGLVVDDAIVVVEAVERHIEEGESPREATLAAMKEVTAPVVSVAVILAAVFIPMAFMRGITGLLNKQFALTIAVSVLFSAFNALTLSPALSALLLRPRTEAKGVFARFFAMFNGWFGRATNGYVRGSGFLARKAIVGVGILAAFSILSVATGKTVQSGFIPEEDQGYFFMNVTLQDASSLERTDAVSRKIDAILAATPEVQSYNTVAGFSLLSNSAATNSGFYFVALKNWSERPGSQHTAEAVIRRLNQRLSSTVHEAVAFAFAPPAIPGLGYAGGFSMWIQDRSGADVPFLEKHLNEFMAAARKRPEVASINTRSEEHTSELQSPCNLVCRLLLEKKKKK